MPDEEIIWTNPVLGTRTYLDTDAEDIVLVTVQDVEPTIEANKAALNNVADRRFGDGKLVARIPMVTLMQLMRDSGLPFHVLLDERKFNRWLNDSDNRYFRTWPGIV
jgi:hypothetical protein